MNKTTKIILTTLLAFGIYFILDDQYFKQVRLWIYENIHQFGISHIIAYIIFGMVIVAGVVVMHGYKKIGDSLGLNRPFGIGLLFPLLCTLPMYIGFAVVFNINHAITLNEVLIQVVSAAFFEEVLFRAFLFGQLYRYTRLGFIPAVLLGALIFACMHLYQSQDLATLAGIFATTFLGAVLFAWIFTEWQFNIWMPVFLHLFMNFSWLLFSVSDNAFGGMYANIFRIVTIVLAIIGTIVYKRKKGLRLEINKHTIWMKR